MQGERTLREVLLRIIEALGDRADIEPSIVANAAYEEMDPKHASPWRVKLAALLALRDISRGILRRTFDPKDRDDSQPDLWPRLQERYPLPHAKGEEPVYRKRTYLTVAQVLWNADRLDIEADAKKAHANTLRKYAYELQRQQNRRAEGPNDHANP